MAPTKTAVAGKYQSRGDDFIQYVDETGEVVQYSTHEGVTVGEDFITKDGVSLKQLAISGLPPVIDAGTF